MTISFRTAARSAAVVAALGIANAIPAAHGQDASVDKSKSSASAQNGASTASDKEEAVILIIDASGSMRGRMDGRTKWDIAKEAVAKVVSTIPPERALGMMAYGHKGGKCNDIELLRAPGKETGQEIVDIVNRLQPRGETPLSESVKQAAAALKYQEKPATVVIVTDGIESCKADPCDLATQLATDGIDFKAHVIGFGMTEKDGAAVSCLAHNTGGKYLAANDADQLKDALNQTLEAPVDANADIKKKEEPKKAPALFEVDFKNGLDLAKWEIVRENKARYGTIDGKLMISGTHQDELRDPKAENIFLAKADLPQGDFDLKVDFTATMSVRNALASVAIYLNENEFVQARLYRADKANGVLDLDVQRMAGGKLTAAQTTVPTVDKTPANAGPIGLASQKHMEASGGRLTLSKRGVKVFAQFEYLNPPPGGDYQAPVRTGEVSLFQPQGKLALSAAFWNPCWDWCGETIVRFERVELRTP